MSGFDSEEPTEPEMTVRNLSTLHGDFVDVRKIVTMITLLLFKEMVF